MAGRGRGLSATLPAWMQQGSAAGGVGAPGGSGPGPAPLQSRPPGLGGPSPGFPPPPGGIPSAQQPGAPGTPPGWPPQAGGSQQMPGMRPPQQQPPPRPGTFGLPNLPPQGMQHQQAGVGGPPPHYGGFAPPSQHLQGFSGQRPDLPHPGAHLMPQQPPGQGPRPMAASPLPGAAVGPGGLQPGAPGTAASPAQQARGGWTEHTAPTGRKYWHNATTKKSVWERPPEFQAAEAKPVPATPPPAAAPAAAPLTPGWREFTAPDGRKYYHNKALNESRWTMPEEMKSAAAAKQAAGVGAQPPSVQVVKLEQERIAQSNGLAAAGQQAVKLEPAPAQVKPEVKADAFNRAVPSKPFMYGSKEEAKDAFKEMLAEIDCKPDWTWEQTLRLIVNHPRYSALNSLGEKKACHKEYQDARAKAEKEEARVALRKAREDFIAMLDESRDVRPGLRFSKAAALFDHDPRWSAVVGDREREELLIDHLKDRERKEREAKKAEQKKRKAAFRVLLEESSYIKASSTWRKVQGKLEGEEAYEALDKIDRLEVFEVYIRELDKRDREKLEKEKEEKRRKERKNRDAFKALLQQHRAEGLLHAKLRWKEYVDSIKKEPAYLAVEKNVSGSRPKELFDDCIEEVEELFTKDRTALKDAMKQHSIEITTDSTYEEFSDALREADADLEKITLTNRKLVFEELQGRLKEKLAKEEKKRKQAREDFASLVRHTRGIEPDTAWEDAESLLQKAPAFTQLGEADRKEVYEEVLEKLRQRRDKEAKQAELEREKEKEKAKERDDDKGRDKKRHKKDRHSEREKEGSPEHRRHHKSSKRHHSDEDERRSKRHKKDKDRERSKHRDRGEEAHEAAEHTAGGEVGEAAGGEDHAAAPEATRTHRTARTSPASTPRSRDAREEGEL